MNSQDFLVFIKCLYKTYQERMVFKVLGIKKCLLRYTIHTKMFLIPSIEITFVQICTQNIIFKFSHPNLNKVLNNNFRILCP